MPSVKLSPIGNDQIVTHAGAPASGWYWSAFAAGSSSPQPTYTSSAGTVAQAAQIVLNADGVPDNPIWLVAGLAYKFVLYDDSGVSQRTVDNVVGINDTSVSIAQWVASGLTPTYISASQFSLVGDQTTDFHVGRRVQATVTAGTVYGTITASAYTTLTTVTVALDSGSLDSGLSAVNLSILRADNPALPKSATVLSSMGALNKAGDTMTGALNAAATATVASATTTDIGAAASNSVIISGTTTITGLGSIAAGAVRDVTFSGALTLTHNATSLILPAGANITTGTGDTASFVSLGSGNWRCLSYQKADGTPLKLGTNSLANSGYQKLLGGLILQWGRGTTGNGSATVTFPLAFPNACFVVAPAWNMGAANQSANAITATTPTASGFAVYSTAGYVFDFFWFAIGN